MLFDLMFFPVKKLINSRRIISKNFYIYSIAKYSQMTTKRNTRSQIRQENKKAKTIHDKNTVNTISVTPGKYEDAIDKLSHVVLSDEQVMLKGKILAFIRKGLEEYDGKNPSIFVIQGDAGTGKSVILNSLFNEIQKISRTGDDEVLKNTNNYLVVNHPEMLKLYHRIAQSFSYLKKKDLERPTTLINTLNKEKKSCDLVIIDEAHLLATSKNPFKRFLGDNQLLEIMKLSKVLVIVYDDKQSLRMDQYWSEDGLNGGSLSEYTNMAKTHETYYLKKQFRMGGCDEELRKWILELSTEKKIGPIPTEKDVDFEFKIWDNCQEMYEELQRKNDKYGQCRMLCTYDFPYRIGTEDWFVTCNGGFKLRWDRFMPKNSQPWSERPDTIDEVGSVYTIQGFDLNYAGVILGRSVGYDPEKDEIIIKPEFYDDHAGFSKKKNISDVDRVKEKIVLNSINVLLTRAVRGLYIFAWDEQLRNRLNSSITSVF